LTALPIEKNAEKNAEKPVVTPVGQPRTTRRRREQRPALAAAPVATFADLGVPAPLVTALGNDGITVPFPVQAATLPDALAGRHDLGLAQTGAGTTLALATTGPITVVADHTYSVFAMGELADGSFRAVVIADNARSGGVGVSPGSGGGGMSRGQVVLHSALVLGGLLAILAILVALRSVLSTSPHRRG